MKPLEMDPLNVKNVQINPLITEIWTKKMNICECLSLWHLSDYREAELLKNIFSTIFGQLITFTFIYDNIHK